MLYNQKYGDNNKTTTHARAPDQVPRTVRRERRRTGQSNRLQLHPFCQAVCETCGDDPEMLTIIYETKGGKQYGESYDYFGLPNLLETLDKWDEEHS